MQKRVLGVKSIVDEPDTSKFVREITEFDFSLSREAQTQLIQYVELLYKWNQVYNLTGLRKKFQMYTYHVLDSLSILPELAGVSCLADVGCGGGMPGIPLTIAKPEMSVTLIDASSKKMAFIRQVIAEIGLKNATAVQGRVEELKDLKFEVIVSRAFAELGEFVRVTKQLLADGGCWLAMKGTYPYEELSQLPEWIILDEVKSIYVPGLNAQRHLVRLSCHKG